MVRAAPRACRSRRRAILRRPVLKRARRRRNSVSAQSRPNEFKAGATVGIDIFSVGQKVDVTGVTIGKGFAGAIKRHHFSSNRATHGNSVSTNAPGSIGMRQDPGRVMPGKRMAGHLGDKQRTTQNLVVARIDTERQLLLIRGAVPGAAGGDVVVRPAAKAKPVQATKAAGK